MVGNGFEYEIVAEVKKAGLPLIVPVAFPEAPHVEDADAALGVRLKDLRRWELAPGNPALLERAGIPFAITAWRLRSVSDFRKNVRRAVEAGLSKDAALEAVTIGPARLLGVDAVLGTVEKGKIADLVIADGDLFDEKTAVRRLFIDGEPVEVEQESRDFDPAAKIDPRGTWEVVYSFRGETLTRTWKIEGTPGALAGTAEIQSGTVPLSSLSLVGNKLTGSYAAGGATVEFTWIIKGEQFSGTSVPSGGNRFSYSGRRTGKPGGGGR